MQQNHAASPNLYAIGSRKRSLCRFAVLLVYAVSILAVLYFLLLHLTRHILGDGQENVIFALFLLAGSVFGILINGFFVLRWIPRGSAFVMKDSAAGFVDDVGLRYKVFFKWHALPWRDISRIEYFPSNNGRIHVYMFGPHFPIRFGPTQTGQITTLWEFLKHQMQTSKGVFIERTSSALRQSSTLDMKTDVNDNREAIAKVLLRLSALVLFAYVGLFEYYSYTHPRLPEVSEGRIYKQNNHGYVTYLTASEQNLLHVLEFSAPILLLGGVLLDPRKRIWQRLRNYFPA